MRKTALLLAWLAIVSPLRAAEEGEKAHDATPAEAESPILSLLLLPAHLLAKIAAVLSAEPPKAEREPAKAAPGANSN
jgi:hypothetical protein